MIVKVDKFLDLLLASRRHRRMDNKPLSMVRDGWLFGGFGGSLGIWMPLILTFIHLSCFESHLLFMSW